MKGLGRSPRVHKTSLLRNGHHQIINLKWDLAETLFRKGRFLLRQYRRIVKEKVTVSNSSLCVEEALKSFQHALRMKLEWCGGDDANEEVLEAVLGMGLAYSAMEEYEEAERYFRRVLQIGTLSGGGKQMPTPVGCQTSNGEKQSAVSSCTLTKLGKNGWLVCILIGVVWIESENGGKLR